MKVIPPFLSDDSFKLVEATRPEFVPATGDYIMFAGALGPHKGIDVLFEACEGLDPSIPLVVLGLRRHDTPRRFPEGVIFTDNALHSDVMRAWRHCTIAVVPSRWPDPHPLVALEAMAAGRPVVASAVGGLQSIVLDGTTGVLVPPGDVAALRAGIQRLVADPEERARMGRAGHERATKYTADTIVPEIEQIYREVVSAPPPFFSDRHIHVFG
jgi:glycosyltransferase involved in cell wall biosynthesis